MGQPTAASPGGGLAPGEALHAGLDDGWVLPEPEARQAIQTRSIVFRSFRRDDGLIDIDARFADTRPFAYDNAFRGACAEGSALHHMQLRVTLDRKRTIVEPVAARVPGRPSPSDAGTSALAPVAMSMRSRPFDHSTHTASSATAPSEMT